MKKLILATILAALSISCSKDDNGPSVEIEGVWTLQSFKGLRPYDLNHDGFESSNLLNEFHNCGLDNTFTFSADGTVQFFKQTYISSSQCNDNLYTGTWEKSGNNLNMTFPNETVVYKIDPKENTISIQITPYGHYYGPTGNLAAATAIFIYKKQE